MLELGALLVAQHDLEGAATGHWHPDSPWSSEPLQARLKFRLGPLRPWAKRGDDGPSGATFPKWPIFCSTASPRSTTATPRVTTAPPGSTPWPPSGSSHRFRTATTPRCSTWVAERALQPWRRSIGSTSVG